MFDSSNKSVAKIYLTKGVFIIICSIQHLIKTKKRVVKVPRVCGAICFLISFVLNLRVVMVPQDHSKVQMPFIPHNITRALNGLV